MADILIPATSPEDWKQFLAHPEKQWKTGYSARTLANCWHEANGFPASVRSLLSTSPVFDEIRMLLAMPEHQVPLPGGSRPSQNDIWALARSKSGLVSIAVEGKVSEPFGPTVKEWIEEESAGKHERLDFLCRLLKIQNPPPPDVRYQLLHRTASALIEAERFCAPHAVMVVHSFSQCDEWFDDFAFFTALLGISAKKGYLLPIACHTRPSLHIGWARGEVRYLSA